MVGLVGTALGKVEVLGLLVGEDGQLDVELLEMSASDFFIQLLGQDVDAKRELLRGRPESDLSENLVGEGAGHNERRVSGSASEVNKTTLGEEDDVPARGHGEPIHLRLDVDSGGGILLQPSDVDLNVEVTDVADDSVFGHDCEVLAGDNVPVAGGGDEDVGAGSSVFHGGDFITGHGGLESVDWIDLGDDNASTIRLQRLGALEGISQNEPSQGCNGPTTYALSNVTESSNNGDLSSKHDIGSTLDSIDEGLAASVVVVELALGDRVVNVDSGDLEPVLLVHTVEVMNTGGGLFGETSDATQKLRVLFVDVGGEITTIIEDHVQRLTTGETLDGLVDTPKVFLLGLALPGEDWDAGSSDGRGSMVLGGEDVLVGD